MIRHFMGRATSPRVRYIHDNPSRRLKRFSLVFKRFHLDIMAARTILAYASVWSLLVLAQRKGRALERNSMTPGASHRCRQVCESVNRSDNLFAKGGSYDLAPVSSHRLP